MTLARRAALAAAALVIAGLWAPVGGARAGGSSADVPRRQDIFTTKQCARCHLPAGQPGVGPPLERLRSVQGAYAFAGRLWNHVPSMFTVLAQEKVAWPRIEPAEMASLMTYLGVDPTRDPAPDRLRGQGLLLSKGCLKCHAYRGEGARIGPDLAERRADYAPASTWAATVWRHTPTMAAVAMQRGVLYPRFAGDEMTDLIGFLRAGP